MNGSIRSLKLKLEWLLNRILLRLSEQRLKWFVYDFHVSLMVNANPTTDTASASR